MKLDRETRMTISVLARNGQSGRAIARMLGVDGEHGALSPTATGGRGGRRTVAAGAQGGRLRRGDRALPGGCRQRAGEPGGAARVADRGARLHRQPARAAALLPTTLPEAGGARAAARGDAARGAGAGGLGRVAEGVDRGPGGVRLPVSPAALAQPIRGAGVVAARRPARRGTTCTTRASADSAGSRRRCGSTTRRRR